MNSNLKSEQLISRRQLAKRWSCSGQTIKRRTKSGILPVIRFNTRCHRYRVGDVEQIEQEALVGSNWGKR